jgi:hypothetical protein
MAATTRRSRITKRKGSGITFGHFALPVAAVVALGLLFVGIKLFFLTPSGRGSSETAHIETPVFSEPPAAIAEEPDFMLAGRDPEIIEPEKLDTTDVSMILAGPLAHSGRTTQVSSGTSEQVPAAKNTQKNAAKSSRPSSAATTLPAAKSKWGVQVGAFVNAGSAVFFCPVSLTVIQYPPSARLIDAITSTNFQTITDFGVRSNAAGSLFRAPT